MLILTVASNLLGDNVKILKSEASKTAYQGVLIAVVAIIIATVMVSFFSTGELSLNGIMTAQKNNVALWVLDCIPFVFGFWGQYSSTMLVYQAGAMIVDQTQELRNKADTLEKLCSIEAWLNHCQVVIEFFKRQVTRAIDSFSDYRIHWQALLSSITMKLFSIFSSKLNFYVSA